MARWNGCAQSAIATTLTTNLELSLISVTGPKQEQLTISDYASITKTTAITGAITGFIIGDNLITNCVVGVINGSIISLVYCLSSLQNLG